MQLVKLINAAPSASCVLNAKHGAPRTGSASLGFRAESANDTLVFSNESANDWYLKRDWRGFDLFMFAVESPHGGLTLNLSVGAGPADKRKHVGTTFQLERGWNFLSTDLAELAERIPIDDVRVLYYSLGDVTQPVQLHVDDLILTNNSRDLFGDSTNTRSELYVRQIGGRWRVGVGGQFELTFADGQIVEWFQLTNDPSRLQNLVRGTTLGPTPISGGDIPLRHHLATSQRIVEMNRLRVVVEGEWRMADSNSRTGTGTPIRRWTYAIHADGNVYFGVQAPARGENAPSDPMSLSLSIAATDGVRIEIPSPAAKESRATTADMNHARITGDGVDMLYVLAPPHHEDKFEIRLDAERRVQEIIAAPQVDASEPNRWSGLMRFSDDPSTPLQTMLRQVRQYIAPLQPEVEVGSAVDLATTDPTTGFFDFAMGCYCIQADKGQVRLLLDNSLRTLSAPTFEIEDVQADRVWVYVNHKIHDSVVVTERGHLLFQLPTELPGKVIVEVISKPQ